MKKQSCIIALALLFILNGLFYKSIFIERFILFSNDGTLGFNASAQSELPSAYYSVWADNNWLGSAAPSISLGPSGGIRMICWFLNTKIVIALDILAACLLTYLFFSKRSWRDIILKFTGWLCILTGCGIALCMLFGPRDILEYIPPVGCLVMLFGIIVTFTLRDEQYA